MALGNALNFRDRVSHPDVYAQFHLDFSTINLQEIGWLIHTGRGNTPAHTTVREIRSVIEDFVIHTRFIPSEQGTTGRYILGEHLHNTNWQKNNKGLRSQISGIAVSGAGTLLLQCAAMQAAMDGLQTTQLQAFKTLYSGGAVGDFALKIEQFLNLSVVPHPKGYPLMPLHRVIEEYDDQSNLDAGHLIPAQPLMLDWVLRTIAGPQGAMITHVDCQFWIDLGIYGVPPVAINFPDHTAVSAFAVNLRVLRLQIGAMVYDPGWMPGRNYANEGYRVADRDTLHTSVDIIGVPPLPPQVFFLTSLIRGALGNVLEELDLSSTRARPFFEDFFQPLAVPILDAPAPTSGRLTILKLKNFTIGSVEDFITFLDNQQNLEEVHLVNLQTIKEVRPAGGGAWAPRPFWPELLRLFAHQHIIPVAPPVPPALLPSGSGFPSLREVNIENLMFGLVHGTTTVWAPWDVVARQPISTQIPPLPAPAVAQLVPGWPPAGSNPAHTLLRGRFLGDTGGIIPEVAATAYARGTVGNLAAVPVVLPSRSQFAKLRVNARARYWFH